jgi:hypothetical protein
MGEWSYSSTILDLGSRWRWVVSFTPRPIYLRGNSFQYSLNRRILGPRSAMDAVEKIKSLAPVGNRTLAVQPIVRRCTV